jgi:hypothetical protein
MHQAVTQSINFSWRYKISLSNKNLIGKTYLTLRLLMLS